MTGGDLSDGTPRPITQDFKQVWFAGVHSDVGGSYAPDKSGLSQIALEWMLVEAESRGLLLHPDKVKSVLCYSPRDSPCAPNPEADLNISLCGAWWILEYLPHKSYNFETKRDVCLVPRGSPRPFRQGRNFARRCACDGRNGRTTVPKICQSCRPKKAMNPG
jgi:hypothetical protein